MAKASAVGVVLVLSGLALAAPGAQACSWIYPAGFQAIDWSHESLVLTTIGYEVGRVHRANDTFGVLANGFPGLRFAASPDGRWLVNASGDTRPDSGPPRDSCAMSIGQTRAADTATGLTFELAPAAARSLAGSGEGVLMEVAASNDLLYYEWGAWDRVKALPKPPLGPGDSMDLYGLAPSRFFLVVPQSGPVVILDPDDGSYVALDPVVRRDGDRTVFAPAASPDGRFLAALWREGGTRHDEPQTYQVGVFSLADGERVRRLFLVDGEMDPWLKRPLAWHPEGLAVALPTTLRVFPAPMDSEAASSYRPAQGLTGGVDWSPTGDRIALGVLAETDPEQAELWILDGDFTRLERYAQRDLEASWKAPWRSPVQRHWDQADTVIVGEAEEAIPASTAAAVLVVLVLALALRRRQPL